MRVARGLLLTVALAFGLAPEFPRYRAERELRVASDALRLVVSRPADVADPPGALERIGAVANSAASALPYDPRPWILAGSARLVAWQPDRALEHYRKALALGERAETDLNLARAYEALGETQKASGAYMRAGWISPVLLPLLLPDVAAPITAEVARLEAELKAGRLKAPPPLP